MRPPSLGSSTCGDSPPHTTMEENELTSLDWLQSFDLSRTPIIPSTTNQNDDKEGLLDENRNRVDVSSPKSPNVEKQRRSPSSNVSCQCTFSCLIYRAIEDSPQKALPLQGMYDWVLRKYPDFADRSSQWKRSLRHSLSLNSCFVRFPELKGKHFGSRGSWWTVHPDFRRAFGSTVMRLGPQHRCLPRTGHNSKWPLPKHLGTSEMELVALEQDLRAAATMIQLKCPPTDHSMRKTQKKKQDSTKKKSVSISDGEIRTDHCYLFPLGRVLAAAAGRKTLKEEAKEAMP